MLLNTTTNLSWLHAQVCDTIDCESFNPQKKDITMGAKKRVTDLKTFIENVNKKDKVNGLKIRFAFVKRKRK